MKTIILSTSLSPSPPKNKRITEEERISRWQKKEGAEYESWGWLMDHGPKDLGPVGPIRLPYSQYAIHKGAWDRDHYIVRPTTAVSAMRTFYQPVNNLRRTDHSHRPTMRSSHTCTYTWTKTNILHSRAPGGVHISLLPVLLIRARYCHLIIEFPIKVSIYLYYSLYYRDACSIR